MGSTKKKQQLYNNSNKKTIIVFLLPLIITTASCQVQRGYGIQLSTHSNATCKKENYSMKTISKTTRLYGSMAEKLIRPFSGSNLNHLIVFASFRQIASHYFLSRPDV